MTTSIRLASSVLILCVSVSAAAQDKTKTKTQVLTQLHVNFAPIAKALKLPPHPLHALSSDRLTIYDPQRGLLEHWGDASRERWSFQILRTQKGVDYILYQQVSTSPDSPDVSATNTHSNIHVFKRRADGQFEEALFSDITDTSITMLRFPKAGGIQIMTDRLDFIPHKWNGHKLIPIR